MLCYNSDMGVALFIEQSYAHAFIGNFSKSRALLKQASQLAKKYQHKETLMYIAAMRMFIKCALGEPLT